MEQLLELLLKELGEDAVVFNEGDYHNVRVDGEVDLGAIAALVLRHSAKVVRASVVHRKPGGGVLLPFDMADELERQAAEARS